MTALARGIILSGDLGQLVIEASDAEVARFSQRQLVEVRALQDPLYPPTHIGMYFYGRLRNSWLDGSTEFASGPMPRRLGGSVNVRLLTRCGCERVMAVPAPPPPIIEIALLESSPLTRSADGQFVSAENNYSKRRFHYARLHESFGQSFVEYLEER